MHHREFEPPAALRDAVACFWYDKIGGGARPPAVEVLPDAYVEIVFHVGGPCAVAGGAPLPSPFVVGLLGHPLSFEAAAGVEILAVRCFPWTVVDLFGVAPPWNGVAGLDHPFAALHPPLAARLRAHRIEAAVDLVARALADLRAQAEIDARVARAGLAMRAAQGGLPVGRLAAAAHATVRTLERRFKHASGHTLKEVSSLTRFEQARNRLWTGGETDLAALAQALGYADQSHLSREFKRYSGMTPAAFARKRRGLRWTR